MSRATGIVARTAATYSHDFLRDTPGAFYYLKNDTGAEVGIVHSCPCGCRQLSAVYFPPSTNRVLWQRSGTQDKPTVSPSIGIFPSLKGCSMADGKYHWHGYLRNGVWESA